MPKIFFASISAGAKPDAMIKKCGAEQAPHAASPASLFCPIAENAYAACGPQIFILRVSGIRNRLSTKHTAGTAIG